MSQIEPVTVRTSDEGKPARRKPESLAKIKKAARKLFVERGYHATRPQDIAREAGLGHGTFYLHYPDKRACFMAFVDDARSELDAFLRAKVGEHETMEAMIAKTLSAIFDYAQTHPGVLSAAMSDEAVIDAEGAQAVPLVQRWGRDWATIMRQAAARGEVHNDYDFDIIGQAILGAIHQCGNEGTRANRDREAVIRNLSRFLVRALKP